MKGIDHRPKDWAAILISLSGIFILCFVASLFLGSVSIPLSEVWAYFTEPGRQGTYVTILHSVRMPKAITAALVGAALGVSGLQMQTLFRNPLAGPYVLGISSGAGLGVALFIFLGVSMGGIFSISESARGWLLVFSAALGAGLILLIMAIASVKLRDSTSLLIIGLMFGTASSAIISILQYFSQAENIQAYVMWSFGSLGSLSWSELGVFAPIVLIGILASILQSKSLNAFLLGENYALSMGVNVRLSRVLIVAITAILAGSVTAFCGPIGFIGLAVPHIARLLFQTNNHLVLTPIVTLTGASILLLCDIIAQLPGTDTTLPINAITALLGAPFVVFLILRARTLHLF